MAGLSQENPLKNVFNEKVVRALAERIKAVHPEFDAKRFVADTVRPFKALGFIERNDHLRDTLHAHLPKSFEAAVQILVAALEPELVEGGETPWESFPIMSQCSYVSKYGRDHFDLSMNALYEMTKRFSAEGDLRTFIEIDPGRAMETLERWCSDPNQHVRRLVSEGTRPRLPLAGRIPRFQNDPRPVIKLLDRLVDDESLYVRRSVANNINDIAKDNPEIAIAALKRWNKQSSKEIRWVVKHAARSLIKGGHPEALELFGIDTNANIKVSPIRFDKKGYRLNDTLEFSFQIVSCEKKAAKLIVDYVIDYVKANGRHREKVFKLRELTIRPGETVRISKRHLLRDTSGRTHYAGPHKMELQINGKRFARNSFPLHV